MRSNRKIKNTLIRLVVAIIILILPVIISNIRSNDLENTGQNVQNETIDTSVKNLNISIDNIPPYSGNIVITINNDVPYFEDKNIKTEEFENYSNLDELNRAGVAFANICKYTMPPKDTKRGSLSYKPTGWVQYLYGENNKEHLYERCHLIAWQLGNENNNKRNLITGTCQMNEAMIKYENMVADWIKNKNKEDKDYHVLYRVTPIYEGTNSLATGVQLEAKSVEEEGVLFNKFIYNVQDNFEIDYSTGKATLKE